MTTLSQRMLSRGMTLGNRVAGERVLLNGRYVTCIVERDVEIEELTEAGNELIKVHRLTIAAGAMATFPDHREAIEFEGEAFEVYSISRQSWASTLTIRRAT